MHCPLAVLDFEGANEREGLRRDAQARLRNRRPAQRPEHPSASSATGWAVAISVVGRDWHDRHHYVIATITVRIDARVSSNTASILTLAPTEVKKALKLKAAFSTMLDQMQ